MKHNWKITGEQPWPPLERREPGVEYRLVGFEVLYGCDRCKSFGHELRRELDLPTGIPEECVNDGRMISADGDCDELIIQNTHDS